MPALISIINKITNKKEKIIGKLKNVITCIHDYSIICITFNKLNIPGISLICK